MQEYVERSYHEVLINALAHRDYLVNGSGFGMIIDAYEFQVNYTEDKKPHFRFDRAGFIAIMPNLNYDVPQGDHQIDEMLSIKNMISANGNITVNEMADKLGVSPETVRRRLRKIHA